MVEPLDEKFVEEMREKLSEQWSEFERVRKKEEHDARIVSDEGRKKWLELKECVKRYIEAINDGLELLSYSENVSPNELLLEHELSKYKIQIAFDPGSAVISYTGDQHKGEFRPRVRGDVLEYKHGDLKSDQRQIRKITFADEPSVNEDEAPAELFPADKMGTIILGCYR